MTDILYKGIKMRRIFILTALLGSFLFIISCNQGTKESSADTDSSIAKNFSLDSLIEDKEVSLEDFKGKAVVLNFWATWCGPCREEMPLLEKSWNKYKDKGVVFLGIDVMDDKGEAAEFIESTGITYPNLYDPSGKVSSKYKVIALPATFFIDKEGTIPQKNYDPFLRSDGKKKLKLYRKEISD